MQNNIPQAGIRDTTKLLWNKQGEYTALSYYQVLNYKGVREMITNII